MNPEYQTIINSLKAKIEKLISAYEQSVAEIAQLNRELSLCTEERNSSINKIKELEEKVNKLQLAEAFKTSSGDVKEAKQKIGKIVREINKCIALLND